MAQYFDAAVIIPLEEEFEVVLGLFQFDADLSDESHVRFAVSLPGSDLKILLVKQSSMGRTANHEAAQACLNDFRIGLLVCVGIAAGLSGDVSIGDVCYTGKIIDVSDNAKIKDLPSGKQEVTLSPTLYDTPRAVTIPISLDRIDPTTKTGFEAWVKERYREGTALLPGEFSGKGGHKETLQAPTVREGAIACGLVSGSPDYNRAVQGTDRKVLALETESGGLFSIAKQHEMPALTIRGISDYAGADKNRFEADTRNQGRHIAVLNAASFLVRQLSEKKLALYLRKLRESRGQDNSQLSFILQAPEDRVSAVLLSQNADFDEKLRVLAPGQARGYRLPVPRLRTLSRSAVPDEPGSEPVDVRDALRDDNIITLYVPREYPDLSLSWIIASDLTSVQYGGKQLIPDVIDARLLQRPRTGVAQLANPRVTDLISLGEVQVVFIIDNFQFDSRTRRDFLKEQILVWPRAKFLILTRDRPNVPSTRDFLKSIGSIEARICDVSFLEMSYFIQKNFEMTGPASQVIASRLLNIFRQYALSAHPSYFAGIPRNTLNALLQANRRAELLSLAIAGYLSFVVADDIEPISLSRTTRERFLTDFAFLCKAEGRSFTEADLTDYTQTFARRFDYKISPARFVSSFIENGILHTENEIVHFTLPFMEAYLLAKRLIENEQEAIKYFRIGPAEFDYAAFALYAELGPAAAVVKKVSDQLSSDFEQLSKAEKIDHVFQKNTASTPFLERQGRGQSTADKLRKAEEDVRNDRDQSHEKQRLLDAVDRMREATAARLLEDDTDEIKSDRKEEQSVEERVTGALMIAVGLLGSGAERLEASTKRELIKKIIETASLIINNAVSARYTTDFSDLRKSFLENDEIVREVAAADLAKDMNNARDLIGRVLDLFEYTVVVEPFLSIVSQICEEAQDSVLAESIAHTDVSERFQRLVRGLWLAEVDVSRAKTELSQVVRSLPPQKLLRNVVASHLFASAYWRQWKKGDRLTLLRIAGDCLKGCGFYYDARKAKQILDNLPENFGMR